MYLRFEHRRRSDGIFQIFAEVRDELHRIRAPYRAEFESLLRWLWNNTPAPGRNVYARVRGLPSARTWWRREATAHVEAAWRACHILNTSGYPVRPIAAYRAPGEIVFEDELQVVIVPRTELVQKCVRVEKRRDPCTSSWSGDRRTIRRMTG
jgi:hypothetical protein